MIDGFVKALDVTAQPALTTETSVDIQIPGQIRDNSSSILRRISVPIRVYYATIDVTDIPIGTPSLAVQFFIVDRATSTELKIGEETAISTVSTTVVLIGDTPKITQGVVGKVLSFPLSPLIRIKGVTSAGTGSPTITYKVGLELGF